MELIREKVADASASAGHRIEEHEAVQLTPSAQDKCPGHSEGALPLHLQNAGKEVLCCWLNWKGELKGRAREFYNFRSLDS